MFLVWKKLGTKKGLSTKGLNLAGKSLVFYWIIFKNIKRTIKSLICNMDVRHVIRLVYQIDNRSIEAFETSYWRKVLRVP